VAGLIALAVCTALPAWAEVRENVFWVHGGIAEPESYYGKYLSISRYDRQNAFYISDLNTVRWVNVPMTNPSVTENTDDYLVAAFLKLGFGDARNTIPVYGPNQASVTRVEVWDGKSLVTGFNTPIFLNRIVQKMIVNLLTM